MTYSEQNKLLFLPACQWPCFCWRVNVPCFKFLVEKPAGALESMINIIYLTTGPGCHTLCLTLSSKSLLIVAVYALQRDHWLL